MRLITYCKGELEEYKAQPQSMEKVADSEKVIKGKIAEVETTSEDKKPVAVCFNRNW